MFAPHEHPASTPPLVLPEPPAQPKGKLNHPFVGDVYFGDSPDEIQNR
jgi:hypothetical protein